MNVIENISKIMGWCPHASTIEARKSVQFDDMMVNADSGGELTHTTGRWWNKYRNIVLMQSLIMSGMSVCLFRPFIVSLGTLFFSNLLGKEKQENLVSTWSFILFSGYRGNKQPFRKLRGSV